MIPSHQFGFREKHSTIDQVHRLTDVIENAFEHKKICSAVFLDVSQAFDKVWHDGLIHKLKTQLPISFCKFLESYLSERYFIVKQGGEYSDLKPILAGIPQGSILGPTLYLLYTNDIPVSSSYFTATFADDTALLAVGDNELQAARILQEALHNVSDWTKRWKVKLNHSKSVHVDFTNKSINPIKLYIDNNEIPHSNTAKYLGMTLDAKLHWKEHVKIKREELNIKLAKINWLLCKRSMLSNYNKLLIYKQILKPVWTYGIQLWGCSSDSNIDIIQRFQNKVLRIIMKCHWYIRNADLHRDLEIDAVKTVVQNFA